MKELTDEEYNARCSKCGFYTNPFERGPNEDSIARYRYGLNITERQQEANPDSMCICNS